MGNEEHSNKDPGLGLGLGRGRAGEIAGGSFLQVVGTGLLVLGIAALVWTFWQDREHRKAEDASVEREFQVHISQAFANWKFEQPANAPLLPAIVWTGRKARIIAIAPMSRRDTLFIDGGPEWDVLAKSERGRYFRVSFTLCEMCEVDEAHSGARRLTGRDFRPLSDAGAKEWLFRHGMREQYVAEFGEEPPPQKIDG